MDAMTDRMYDPWLGIWIPIAEDEGPELEHYELSDDWDPDELDLSVLEEE